jgi:DUF218 domain
VRLEAMKLIALVLLLIPTGCTKYVVDRPPAAPFDAVVLPGCPSEDDGSPSRCQIGRAGQAALLWSEGWTRNFIVSGSDVHTPYVEAEAIAQVMTVLGVPPERIVLEPDALHSDENIYYSLVIAGKKGFTRLAVASNGSVASLLCSMMVHWGHDCSAIKMDVVALARLLPRHEAAIHSLRAPRSKSWVGLADREARIARTNGHSRPASFLFYPLYGWLASSHRPIAPAHDEVVTWEERLEQLLAQYR